MSGFSRFYRWSLRAKSYMGLYFTALVVFGGLLTALFGGQSLPLFTLLQMFLLSLLIGFAQAFLLPKGSDFSSLGLHVRLLVWLLASSFATALCAFFFHWLPGLPFWYPWALGAFMLFACGAMLVGMKMEQDRSA